MSSAYYHWKVKCATDGLYYTIITTSDSEPTICPDNSAHSVVADSGLIQKVVEIDDKKLSHEDGRQVVSIGKFPDYYNPAFTGESDDFANGVKYGGERLVFEHADGSPAETTTVLRFVEPITMMGGEVRAYATNADDYMTVKTVAPATPKTANGSSTGNCNLYDVTGGGHHMLIPAPGNGAYDVDLTAPINANLAGSAGQPTFVSEAVPVPAWETDGVTPNGYWDWNELTGEITPNYQGTGYYNLFDFQIGLITFMNKWCLYSGSPTIEFVYNGTVDHRGGMVLPQWEIHMITTRASSHDPSDPPVFISVGLITARRNS